MRWKNKGHEFDEIAEKLLKSNPQKKFYIFGAGLLGKELLTYLQQYHCIGAFIDNDKEKQKIKLNGFDIISFTEYLQRKDGQIVIAASPVNSKNIKKQLEENFLEYQTDFFLYDEFIKYIFPIISTYYFNKSYVGLAQITLTERCTLKCKKCAHGCYAVNNATSKDMRLEQVYKSADSFFAKVDFIKEFVLIGGEPLLYKDLVQVICYIGERYRAQMDLYVITTNGTIIPDEEVLKACKKYNILFRISNYTRQIPRLKKSYQRLIAVLENYGISFSLGEEESEWMDYGFDYLNRDTTEDGLIEVFDTCQTPCREVRENRFYFCVMARSVSDNLQFHVGAEDYLDLDKLNGNEYKKIFLEFTMGYSLKGYLDMCKYCNGADAKYYPIAAAEQV